MSAPPEPRAAIIGGGPAGLTMGRALQLLGIPFTIFERNADFGGLWNAEDPESPVYDSAHLISSRAMTGFADWPMPADWPDYPSARLVLRYVRDYARRHGLHAHARFGQAVTRAEPLEGGGWRVTLADGSSESFRWVVAANGSNRTPFLPGWPGEFAGRLRHGSAFRNADDLRGKRVLVVGLGNSGADIACDAAHVAARVAVSIRRGYHVIPKHILGKPADVFADSGPGFLPLGVRQRLFQLLLRVLVGDLGRFGMPKPDHRLLETHPLLSDQLIHHLTHGDIELVGDIAGFDGPAVRFADGHSEEFDEVIACTGFTWTIPYIDPALLPWERGRLHPPLAIFPEVEGLFLLSFVESNGSSFSLFNAMAPVIGRAMLLDRDDPAGFRRMREHLRRHAYDVTGGLRMLNSDRHVGYMDNRAYRRALDAFSRRMGWPRPLALFEGATAPAA